MVYVCRQSQFSSVSLREHWTGHNLNSYSIFHRIFWCFWIKFIFSHFSISIFCTENSLGKWSVFTSPERWRCSECCVQFSMPAAVLWCRSIWAVNGWRWINYHNQMRHVNCVLSLYLVLRSGRKENVIKTEHMLNLGQISILGFVCWPRCDGNRVE